MGFPCVSLEIPKCLSITLLVVNLVDCFKFMVLPILMQLGLVKPLEQPELPPLDNNVLVMDGYSLISVPVHTLTSLIKNKLPLVQYGDLLRRSAAGDRCGEDAACSVCLDCLDASHVIRELPNCCHVFHQHCLDRWVDEGQVGCPLCRSMLFPAKSFSRSQPSPAQ